MAELLQFLPAIMVAIFSLVLFLNLNWRWNIISVSLQYVAVFWLVLTVWPTGLAAVKLVTGWMAGAIIGSSLPEDIEKRSQHFQTSQEDQRFRVVIWAIVVVIVWSLLPNLAAWLPVKDTLIFSGALLIIMGLLQLSMAVQSFRIIFGLLTVFSGFEIIYAALEKSVLVAGLLAVVPMGIAFIGAYLMHAENEGSAS